MKKATLFMTLLVLLMASTTNTFGQVTNILEDMANPPKTDAEAMKYIGK